MSKKDEILDLFEANPGGIKVAEVAAQVGCTTTRVYEVIKDAGSIKKISPGFYGLDPKGDLSDTIKTGGKTRPKRAKPVEELRELLVRGVEISIVGEKGRFRYSKIGRNDKTGDEWIDAHDEEGAARAFFVDRLVAVHDDVQMPPLHPDRPKSRKTKKGAKR